jgi:hypothetical protein
MPENSKVVYKNCDECVEKAEKALSLGIGDNSTKESYTK